MNKHLIKKITKIIFLDFLVYGILYFPVWWYSKGFYKVLLKCLRIISDAWESLGISIQMKYLFKPMYGQKDVTGILISFVMRIIMLIFKLISMFFVFILCSVLMLGWAFLPIIVVFGIVENYKFLKQ